MLKTIPQHKETMTLICFLMILYNLVTIGSVYNLLLTLPQIVLVLYYLMSSKIREALFWHIIFIISSIAATSSASMFGGNEKTVLYGYPTLKLIGPVGVSYLLSFLIFFNSLSKYSFRLDKSLFSELFRILLWFLFSGVLIGVVGLVVSPYYSFDAFVKRSIYALMVVVNMACFVQNNSKDLREAFAAIIIPLVASSCIAAIVSFYVIGVKTIYSSLEGLIGVPDICMFAPVLFLYFFKERRDLLTFGALACIFIILQASAGGKMVLSVIGAIIICVWYLFRKERLTFRFRLPLIIALIIVGVYAVGQGIFDSGNVDATSRTSIRYTQILNIIVSGGDLDLIKASGFSPFIRIGEFLNLAENGLHNPLGFLFGYGFGGYYLDNLGLFKGIPWESNWSYEEWVTQRYVSAHDAFSSIPLYNGFLGLYLVVRISIKFLKRIKNNIFAFGVIPWLLLQYYFNIQTAVAGMVFLYIASEGTSYNAFQKYQPRH